MNELFMKTKRAVDGIVATAIHDSKEQGGKPFEIAYHQLQGVHHLVFLLRVPTLTIDIRYVMKQIKLCIDNEEYRARFIQRGTYEVEL